jgi:GntR family transcriptional regulator
MALKIDPHSHVPIYLQIVDQVHAAVAAGVYRPGEPLPAQRTLALSLGVNPNTVQKAFDELERRELVVPRRGVGMFVADRGTASARIGRRAFSPGTRCGAGSQSAGRTGA